MILEYLKFSKVGILKELTLIVIIKDAKKYSAG